MWPAADPHPLPWACRYFILTGSVLRYYKSERDAALTPRGVVDIQVGRQGRVTLASGGGGRDGVPWSCVFDKGVWCRSAGRQLVWVDAACLQPAVRQCQAVRCCLPGCLLCLAGLLH